MLLTWTRAPHWRDPRPPRLLDQLGKQQAPLPPHPRQPGPVFRTPRRGAGTCHRTCDPWEAFTETKAGQPLQPHPPLPSRTTVAFSLHITSQQPQDRSTRGLGRLRGAASPSPLPATGASGQLPGSTGPSPRGVVGPISGMLTPESPQPPGYLSPPPPLWSPAPSEKQ